MVERRGNRSKSSVPRNAYPTADARWIVVSSTTDATARRLFRAIGRDDLADDPTLATNVLRALRAQELDDIVAAWMIRHTQEEALGILHACEVAAGPINDVAQFVWPIPHIVAQASIATLDDTEISASCAYPASPRISTARPAISAGPGARRSAPTRAACCAVRLRRRRNRQAGAGRHRHRTLILSDLAGHAFGILCAGGAACGVARSPWFGSRVEDHEQCPTRKDCGATPLPPTPGAIRSATAGL